MGWRLANSLVKLRDQVDAAYPNRAKASDGSIGDAAHQRVPSDHNPNAAGVVTALDITHSPQTGFDAHALANRLQSTRHPDLKYIISNRRIAGDWTGWGWAGYNGSDPHTNHIHISVGRGDDGKSVEPYDDTNAWAVGPAGPPGPYTPPQPVPAPSGRQTVTLPKHVASWAFYREGSGLRKGTSDQIYTLSPKAVGRDLTYDILGWVGGNAVIINSADKGRGVIWVKDTDAIISNGAVPAVPPPAPGPARQTVTLPRAVTSWAFYREGTQLRKGTSDQIYTLSPAGVGRDLTYDILGWVGDYAVAINSTDKGRGVIWVKGTEAIIR